MKGHLLHRQTELRHILPETVFFLQDNHITVKRKEKRYGGTLML